MKTLLLRSLFCLLFPLLSHGAELITDDPRNPFPPGFQTPPDQPEGWSTLPPGRPFPALPSDPRDLKLGLVKNSKSELEANVGGYRSFAGWKGEVKGKEKVLHTGLEGQAYFLMRKEGVKFPLHSSDGVIGLYAEAIRGLWMYQLRFTHLSAHLSDGLYNTRNRFVYTRETLSLRAARQYGNFRVYTGYHFLVHTKPVLPRHSLQVGFYNILPWHLARLHPYFGGDLRVRNAQEGTTYNVIGGLALVSSLGAPPLRFAVNYLKGHDPRGQFYFEKTEKWGFGLEMDF